MLSHNESHLSIANLEISKRQNNNSKLSSMPTKNEGKTPKQRLFIIPGGGLTACGLPSCGLSPGRLPCSPGLQPRKAIPIKLLKDPDAHMYVFLVELLFP
jgi:hypothetical protein